MNISDKKQAQYQPSQTLTQNDPELQEADSYTSHSLDFMDRMYDAASDMTSDDWDDCLFD